MRALERSFAVAAFFVVGAALLSFPWPPVGRSLDQGWGLALGHFLATGKQAGVDYVFTYGPLGYLVTGVYYPGLFWLGYAWAFFFAGASSALLARFMFLLPSRWLWVPWLWLALLVLPHGETSLFVVPLLLPLLHVLEDAWSTRRLAFTGAFLALLSLVKFTLLALSVSFVLLLPWAAPRDARRGIAARLTLAYVVSFCTFWVSARQSLRNVPRFLRLSFEAARGYSEAMTIEGPDRHVHSAALVLALLFVGAALNSLSALRSRRHWIAHATVALVAFLGWKEGFVRQDPSHESVFFGCAAFLSLFVLSLGERTSPVRPLATACLLIAGLSGLSGWRTVEKVKPRRMLRLDHTGERVMANLFPASRPREFVDYAEGVRRAQQKEWALPKVRQKVGREPIDVASYDQSVAFANDLDWHPRPVFQGYVVMGPLLARLNGDFLRSNDAPRFVLARWATIDDRFPAHDDGQFLVELLRRYEPALSERDYLLLERRPANEVPGARGRVTLDRRVRFGETIPLDLDPAGFYTLSVAFDTTFTGAIRRLLFRAPRPDLVVRPKGGKATRYGLSPGLARSEFPLSPLVEGNADLRRIYGGQGRQLEWLRLDADDEMRACYGSSAKIVVRQYPGVALPH